MYFPSNPFSARLLALACMTLFACKAAAVPIDLGTAGDFAVLAGSSISNTGATVINGGNVGITPESSITGFGTVTGAFVTHVADGVALQAQNDLTTAYNTAAGLSPTLDLTGQDLGGMVLLPGTYFFSSSAQLTGALTLDSLGNSASQFVFQIGSTLTTASNSSVVSLNSYDLLCNVYWQIGSSATLGTGTAFQGHILALTTITLNTGATISRGSALARNGAVTLDHNTIDNTTCDVASVPDSGNSSAMFIVALLVMGAIRRNTTSKR